MDRSTNGEMPMRIRKNFAERTKIKSSNEVQRKYFLICEGDATEVQYFDGINNNKARLGIDKLIDIRPVLRSYNEMGWTNPKKLLDRFIECYDDENDGALSVGLFTGRIVDFLEEDGLFVNSVYTQEMIYSILIRWFATKKSLSVDDDITDIEEVSEEVRRLLKRELKIEKSVEGISAYLKRQNITYEEGFDKICLIVDRDKSSFVSNPYNDQFEYVKETCHERGFGFYLTNPCFEFWLLMHFDEVFEYDKEVVAENPKVSNKTRYLENELRKFIPGYKKSRIRFDLLRDRVWKAIENERHFCEDIEGLKSNVGSNIGLLLEEIKG